MVPPRWEYFAVVAMLTLYVCTTWSSELAKAARRREFWPATAIFVLGSICLEVTGKYMSWWRFSPNRISGWMFLGVPIEDYLLLILIYLATIASWESSRANDLA